MSLTLDCVLTEVNLTITNNNNTDIYIRQYLSKLNCVKEIHLNGTALQEIDTGIRKKMRGVMNTDYFPVTANGGSVTLKVPIWSLTQTEVGKILNLFLKSFLFWFDKKWRLCCHFV
jgi:hypothetical protein